MQQINKLRHYLVLIGLLLQSDVPRLEQKFDTRYNTM